MSNWNISIWESSSTYTADGTIPVPNADLETQIVSTMQKIRLANGDDAFVTPETKYNKQPFGMLFVMTTADFRTKITNYIANSDKVQITADTGETFTGKFIDMKRVWFSGRDDEYDVTVAFEQFE